MPPTKRSGSDPEKDPLSSAERIKELADRLDPKQTETPTETELVTETTHGAVTVAPDLSVKAYPEQAVPAAFDPAVPAAPISAEDAMWNEVVARKAAGGTLYNLQTFLNGPSQSKRMRLDEMHARADRLGDDPGHFGEHTKEEIAAEVLRRAGILTIHPELVLPFADVLESVVLEGLTGKLRREFKGE
jgi:hypothetical protein